MPYPRKAKEHYKLFFKKKARKIPQASKTVKNRNKSYTKFVLKSIKQSNIITQKLKTVEKPNTFYIEPVTTEHARTAKKLLKSKETSKIITQQTNKMKIYTESKAADRT